MAPGKGKKKSATVIQLEAQLDLMRSLLPAGAIPTAAEGDKQVANGANSNDVAPNSADGTRKRKESPTNNAAGVATAASAITGCSTNSDMPFKGELVQEMNHYFVVGAKYKKQPSIEGKCPSMEQAIHNGIKEYIWPQVKFSPGPKSNRKMAEQLIEKVRWGGITDNPQVKAKWVQFYDDFCGSSLNGRRSYVQTQLRKPAFTWMAEHGGKMPSKALLKKVLLRDIDPQDAVEWEFFLFWWDNVLPQSSGGRAWNEEKRYYLLLSTAAPPNEPNEHYITASTEAFAALCFLGNKKKWETIYQMSQLPEHHGNSFETRLKHEGKIVKNDFVSTLIARCFPLNNTSLPLTIISFPSNFIFVSSCQWKHGQNPSGKPCTICFGPSFQSKYTQPDAGQSKYGAWTQQALTDHMALRQLAWKGRTKETTKALEERALKELKEKYEKSASSAHEERKARRRKNQSKAATEDDEMVDNLFDYELDEPEDVADEADCLDEEDEEATDLSLIVKFVPPQKKSSKGKKSAEEEKKDGEDLEGESPSSEDDDGDE